MTVKLPNTPASSAQNPDNSSGIKGLQERIRSAFAPVPTSGDSRDQALTHLDEGLRQGRFGGLPIEANTAKCLIELLRALEWPVVPERFAQAMPHFPVQMGAIEVRETLARLGLESTKYRIRASDLSAQHTPALLVDDDGRMSVLVTGKTGTAEVLPAAEAGQGVNLKKLSYLVKFEKATLTPTPAPAVKSWMRDTVRRFRREMITLFVLTGVINAMVLVISFAVMAIYDKVIPAKAMDTLLGIVIGVACAVCVELAFRKLKAKIIGHVSGRIEYLLGTAIYKKLVGLPLEMIVSVPIGAQISRLRQFEVIRNLFAGPFVAIILEIPFMFLFTLILFLIAGPLAIVPVVLIAVYAIAAYFFVPVLKRQNETATRTRAEQYQTLLDTVTNLRVLRGYGCESVWLERLQRKTDAMAAAKRRANYSKRLLTTLSAAAIPVAGGLTVLFGAALVIEGMLTTGALIGSMILIWRVLAPIQQSFIMLSSYSEMAQVFQQVDRMMRLPSKSVPDLPIVRQFNGAITVDRLSFRYPNMSDAALAGVGFEFKAGEMIAVTGPSGAGKSTLMRLILGIYQPQSGSVAIDGVNIRQIPGHELRARIGYVPQFSVMFHGTIAQNLRLAAPAASDEDLQEICKEMGLWETIEALPKGLNTLLDYARQESLPTGFRQALTIMQALIRKPAILLLDEPAKNLDPQLEQAFMAALQRRRGTTTILMISHRPSHIKLADQVLTLVQGQVASLDAPDSGPPRPEHKHAS